MAYVEWHDTVRNHHKTNALMLALKVTRREAVGIIGCISSWAIQYRPGGIIDRKLIHLAVEWEGDPAHLLAALLSCEWLDPIDDTSVQIHDWEEVTRGYKKARSDWQKTKDKAEKAKTKRLLGAESALAMSERTNEQNEQNEMNGNAATAAHLTSPQTKPAKPPPGLSWQTILINHWNNQSDRSPISVSKGTKQLDVAHAAGVSKQDLERAIWDNELCKAKAIWDVLDPLKKKVNAKSDTHDAGYVIDKPITR